MQIQNLITQKYKRFFAFGCSFTHYPWPTWADIIGQNIPHYENWGMGGAGNQFIFNSIIECNRRNKFNEDDLVIVMWTSCSREDRYVDNGWLVAATENRETLYGKEWVKKFNVFDLYTKSSDNKIDVDKVWPYYEALLNKYGLGGQLWW